MVRYSEDSLVYGAKIIRNDGQRRHDQDHHKLVKIGSILVIYEEALEASQWRLERCKRLCNVASAVQDVENGLWGVASGVVAKAFCDAAKTV